MTAWVGVASREHVAAAVEGAFCQFNHGTEAPLRRMGPGVRIIYYAPRDRMRGGEIVQVFVELSTIRAGEPYQVEVTDSFRPYRRDVDYHRSREASIRPLIATLSFTRDRTSWGQAFRYGMFKIETEDLRIIAQAMDAKLEDASMAP